MRDRGPGSLRRGTQETETDDKDLTARKAVVSPEGEARLPVSFEG